MSSGKTPPFVEPLVSSCSVGAHELMFWGAFKRAVGLSASEEISVRVMVVAVFLLQHACAFPPQPAAQTEPSRRLTTIPALG